MFWAQEIGTCLKTDRTSDSMKYGTSYGRWWAPPTRTQTLSTLARSRLGLPAPPPGGLLPHPAQARSLLAGSCPRDARMLRWRIPSCSWWRGGSAASPTSLSPACCSGTGSRATWGGRRNGGTDRAARPGMSGRGGLCVGPRVTRPALACQGHFTRPEGPRLLPRLHQPPG